MTGTNFARFLLTLVDIAQDFCFEFRLVLFSHNLSALIARIRCISVLLPLFGAISVSKNKHFDIKNITIDIFVTIICYK